LPQLLPPSVLWVFACLKKGVLFIGQVLPVLEVGQRVLPALS
jgi:hypothetical protein